MFIILFAVTKIFFVVFFFFSASPLGSPVVFGSPVRGNPLEVFCFFGVLLGFLLLLFLLFCVLETIALSASFCVALGSPQFGLLYWGSLSQICW